METINLFLFAVLNSFAIIGLWTACKPDMLLSFVGDKLHGLSSYMQKPLYLCPPCMASIWGSVWFAVLFALGLVNPFFYPLYILAVSGLNVVLKWFIEKNQSDYEYNEGENVILWFDRKDAPTYKKIEVETAQGERLIAIAKPHPVKKDGLSFYSCGSELEETFGMVISWKHLSQYNA